MTREIKANLYFFFIDIKSSVLIFWSIFMASVVALLIIANLFETHVIISPLMAVCIYCSIVGFFFTKKTMPYCIKFGATRTTFHLSASIFLVLFAISMALINFGIDIIVEYLTTTFQIEAIQLLAPTDALLTSSSWIQTIGSDSILIFFFFCSSYLTGSIVYRFGQIGGYIPIAMLLIAVLMPGTQEILFTFIRNFSTQFTYNMTMISLTAILLLSISWLFLVRASSRPA
ncbi:hypothetical protein ACFFIX_14145 [Metabacillus herbersteinensis]|uniref:Uncharacterized protein n=1 Tax=Metabacillus herbersteinensis TaxID=283816 RepID=A0ABV6GHC5_9BACI